MGAIDVSRVSYSRPGGRQLLNDVSFHVGDGQHVALVGANGVGKSTLLRLICGEEPGYEGVINVDGRLAVMSQLVGMRGTAGTVRDLFTSLSPLHLRAAGAALAAAEVAAEAASLGGKPSFVERAGMRLAGAHAAWGDVGGYEAEVLWDVCATEAIDLSLDEACARPLSTFSGGEQKRLALQLLVRGDAEVLLLDEPDNFLDVPGKGWLEDQLNACRKTILYVSHDRELLAATAHKIVTVEAEGAWTHGGSFAGYHEARDLRLANQQDDHRRWVEERQHLYEYMKLMKQRAMISDASAGKAKAAETKLRHFDEAGPPAEPPKDQQIAMRLGGGRTAKRAVILQDLELSGLTYPFSTELWFGDRVGVLGPNGTGKSHFLRLLAGDPSIAHEGSWRLGSRVVPGHFSQTHDHPELKRRTLLEVLATRDLVIGPAMARLRRYELNGCADQTFETLSGGQQARFQILLLELDGATLLLLDEPTDNLDLASAEALEQALASFEGTVIAVTHDRWFLRSLDRFLVFGEDGEVVVEDGLTGAAAASVGLSQR